MFGPRRETHSNIGKRQRVPSCGCTKRWVSAIAPPKLRRLGTTGRGREEAEKKAEREREGGGGLEKTEEGEWMATVHRDESPLRIGRDRRAATSGICQFASPVSLRAPQE
ncbi:hypothetical protein BHM03_00057804 [Ensete ventricosum]|uniref:Uncharacterized protein n=1 Tax=Ensete ventricosum TaxID=4639 RepID=A0A445MMI2_ENSVE|nr:hypothetical protein BHM03_00057804 [Ensete ventricosum]